MEFFRQIFDYSIVNYGAWGLLLMAALLGFFVCQLWYYLGYYGRIPGFRNSRRGEARDTGDGISVVVVVYNDLRYLEDTLPALLAQEYPNYEIIVVEVGTSEDFSDQLALMKERFPRLATTRIEQDPRFPINLKMAYNVGIKAASFENIILTTSEVFPTSERWLSFMAKGFVNGEVVLGYCGVEDRKGFTNRMIRCDRLFDSVRWLSAAVAGRPYRGVLANVGFTRALYFDNKGFGYLNMNLGEEDLFIARISTGENTSVVMNPHATVRQRQWGGAGWWWRERRFRTSTYKFLPRRARNNMEWELGSRALFFAAAIAVAVIMPMEIGIAAGVMWLLRLTAVRWQMWRIRRRLGERGLGWTYIVYDLVGPFYECALAVSRKLRPAPGVWR